MSTLASWVPLPDSVIFLMAISTVAKAMEQCSESILSFTLEPSELIRQGLIATCPAD